MKQYLADEGACQTKTDGYDPTGNGRVERFVCIFKHWAVMLLMYSRLPLCFWYCAMQYVSYEYRCKMLDTQLPETAPRIGCRVLIQRPLPHKSFESKVEEHIFLDLMCHNDSRSNCGSCKTNAADDCGSLGTCVMALSCD